MLYPVLTQTQTVRQYYELKFNEWNEILQEQLKEKEALDFHQVEIFLNHADLNQILVAAELVPAVTFKPTERGLEGHVWAGGLGLRSLQLRGDFPWLIEQVLSYFPFSFVLRLIEGLIDGDSDAAGGEGDQWEQRQIMYEPHTQQLVIYGKDTNIQNKTLKLAQRRIRRINKSIKKYEPGFRDAVELVFAQRFMATLNNLDDVSEVMFNRFADRINAPISKRMRYLFK